MLHGKTTLKQVVVSSVGVRGSHDGDSLPIASPWRQAATPGNTTSRTKRAPRAPPPSAPTGTSPSTSPLHHFPWHDFNLIGGPNLLPEIVHMIIVNKEGHLLDSKIQIRIFSSIQHGNMSAVHGIIVHQTDGANAQSAFAQYQIGGRVRISLSIRTVRFIKLHRSTKSHGM